MAWNNKSRAAGYAMQQQTQQQQQSDLSVPMHGSSFSKLRDSNGHHRYSAEGSIKAMADEKAVAALADRMSAGLEVNQDNMLLIKHTMLLLHRFILYQNSIKIVSR